MSIWDIAVFVMVGLMCIDDPRNGSKIALAVVAGYLGKEFIPHFQEFADVGLFFLAVFCATRLWRAWKAAGEVIPRN